MERGERYKFKYFITTAALLLAFCCSNTVFADGDIELLDEIHQAFSIKLENPPTVEILTITKNQTDPNVIKDIENSFNIESSYPDYPETPRDSYVDVKNAIYNDVENGIVPVNDFFSPDGKTTPKTFSSSFTDVMSQETKPKTLTPLEEITGYFEDNIKSIPEPTPEEIADEPENLYPATIEETPSFLEGRTIHSISVDGLKTLSENVVLNAIKTKVGNSFNALRLQQDLQNIYATGYFRDDMEVTPILNADGSVDLVYTVKENLIVKDVAISGNTVISTNELMQYVLPLKGLPQNISKMNSSIEQITDCYNEKGYVLGGVSSVDDDENGVLTFTVSEGVINKFIIEGNKKTKDYVITRNMLTRPGTVYNENYLKDDLSKIYATNLFKDVDREIIPAENGEEGQYDIKILVKEASSNSISIGAGIDSGLGAFGSLGFNENNLMGRGQKLSLTGLLGSGILLNDSSIKNRMNYQVELSFFEPYFLNADNSLMSKLYYRELGSFQVPLAIERRFGSMVSVEHKFKKCDKLSTTMGLGFEGIHLKEGDFTKIARMYAARNINIANRKKELSGGTFINFAPAITYNTVDDYDLPRDGLIAQAKFIEALSLDNIHKTNGRVTGRVTKYFPIFEKSALSVTARGGIKAHGDRMPEIMAFSLGGPYSVRGYKVSGVGTGDGFVMGSVELSTPVPFMDRFKYEFLQKMRLNFFVDAGQVFDGTISSKLYDRPMSAISVGVGLKVFVPKIGQISVDYGLPVTNTGLYGSKHGYFTFGTGALDMYGF